MLSESASSRLKAKVNEVLEQANLCSDIVPDISNLTVSNAVLKIIDIRDGMPDQSPLLSRIDTVLIPLMKLDHHDPFQAGPFDIPSTNIFHEYQAVSRNQNSTNVSLLDIDESALFDRISDILGIRYLSEFVGTFDWSSGVHGRLYGPFRRPMVSIPVSTRDRKQYYVHFLVDTGAPCLLLCLLR